MKSGRVLALKGVRYHEPEHSKFDKQGISNQHLCSELLEFKQEIGLRSRILIFRRVSFRITLPFLRKAGPTGPLRYGSKKIGSNGDVGWIEYILLTSNTDFNNQIFASIFGKSQEAFRCRAKDSANKYLQ
ncbi:gibberellin 2-beta-dioxygenase 1-like [Olea europaea subsp. europaea]|uniref:Gibberellin 2-beta-dioxygenase 1-like n=1 Tax=Olea europaea subsp. europaea TaxID=158383 RepID=A0A8S0SDY7_OLEEU|nr:gibberellin 2-beta-dioxygenase 1-like [Olea europaea subsp. europaea]